MNTEQTTNVALACDLAAMDPTQRKRHDTLAKELFTNFQANQELPNGYQFTLPAGDQWYLKLAEWATLERQCCPFLNFEQGLSLDGKIWLRLTGNDDAKQFLRSYLTQ